MNEWVVLIITVMLAAAIGLVTNMIAISMLFRPHRARYIGSWQLPFTPGLIPKRQEEIADHLGKMVVNHLLTVEGIQGRLLESELRDDIYRWTNENLKRWMQNEERSLSQLIDEYTEWGDVGKLAEDKVEALLLQRFDEYIDSVREKPIRDILPEQILHKKDDLIPKASTWMMQRLKSYLQSREGREQVEQAVSQFLKKRGSFVQMVGSFVRTDRLIDRVYPEIVDALTSPDIQFWLERKFHDESEKLLNDSLSTYIPEEEILTWREAAVKNLVQQIPIQKLVHQPISHWEGRINETIMEQIVKTGLQQAATLLENKLAALLQVLKLEDIVSKEVKNFSLPQLEKLVLKISKREFRMIKYLGGLLGGMIGIVQGTIMIFFF